MIRRTFLGLLALAPVAALVRPAPAGAWVRYDAWVRELEPGDSFMRPYGVVMVRVRHTVTGEVRAIGDTYFGTQGDDGGRRIKWLLGEWAKIGYREHPTGAWVLGFFPEAR